MRERTSADITIYGIGGQSIATVPITAASKRVVKLMESDYIQLSFTLSGAVAFPIGSYCDDELFGRFYVTEEQMPRYNTSNGGYDYELKMDAWYWMWNLKQCMLIRNLPSDGSIARSESVWYLTWSLREQMRQYMRNLQLLGFVPDTYDFVTSDTDLDSFIDIDTDNVPKATEALTVSYNGTHLVDVLKNLADTWECEYWITGTEEAFVIHFGKCENGTLQEINLATNAQNITPQDDTSERGDKLFYFGGVDNIPMTYRKTLMMKSLSKTYSGVDFKVKNEEMYAFGKLKAIVHYGYNSSQTIDHTTIGGDTYKAAAEQWFIRHYSGSATYERVVVIPDALAIPIVNIKVYADFTYTDTYSSGNSIRVTEELNQSNTHWRYRLVVHSIWMEATDEDGNEYPLSVKQWSDYALQTVQRRYDLADGIIAISDVTYTDSIGRYVTVSLTGTEKTIKLYINQPADTIVFNGIEASLYYDTLSYRYENVGAQVLYAGALIVMRKSLGSYAWYYGYDGSDFVQYNLYPFPGGEYFVGVAADLSDPDNPDDWYACAGFSGTMNNNYSKHQLTVPAQTLRVRFAIDETSYDTIDDTIELTPHVIVAVCRDYMFPMSPNYAPSQPSVYDNTKIVLQSLNGVVINKADFVYDNEYYYAEFYVQIPFGTKEIADSDLQAATSGGSYGVYVGVQLIDCATGEEQEVTVVDAEFTMPLMCSVKHSVLQSAFYVNVASGSDGYAQFTWQTAPQNYDYFYLVASDVAPSASLAGIPAIYWSDRYDDPASLLSIGDRRLQLPVYNATEFEQYKTDGMTYENGYIVKDDMAYKDGYIIPYAMIGDDDNRSLRELTVTDDTIYPDGKLLVKTVKRVNAKDKIDVEGQSQSLTWNYKQYHLQLRLPESQSVLDFDRDYILPNGEPLKIRFLVPEDVKEYYESGAISQAEWEAIQTQCKLAGMQFNVAYNNEIDYQADDETTSTTHTEDVWIERNDDFGAKLPSEILYPQVLDPCVLVNWNVLALGSLGLIARAEYKLLDKAFEYYAALRNGNFTFTTEMMSDWLFDLVGGLQFVDSDGNNVIDSDGNNILVKNEHAVYAIPQLGQRVRVTHAALADGHKDTRIIGMELSLDKPYDTPKLTIGETEAYSRLKQIEKEITKLN